jgi:nitrate/nitrite transport system substrate-binding protein
MTIFSDPFDSNSIHPEGCGCSLHATRTEPQVSADASGELSDDALLRRAVDTAVVRRILPDQTTRRNVMKLVGASAFAAALADVLPLGHAAEAFAQARPLEKKSLKIGFIPITCATPILMSKPLGFYERQGLDVELVKTAGWAVIRDKTLNGEYDAAHMLAPMPLAISLGVGSNPVPYRVGAIENVNGQAITLALKHRNKRDPRQWKGFKFAVPLDFSMHNYLLRYYLAEAGLDPDRDVQIRSVPPPEMVANLRAGNLDGFLAPDPVNQRAVYDEVGFIHILSKDIWNGHPCCTFASSQALATQAPNSYAAMMRGLLQATAYAAKPQNRKQIASAIAPTAYLNQPVTVVEQVLTGTFADGLGKVRRDPNRIAFNPFPYESFGVWILTQMKRWGQIKGDVDYQGVARRVFQQTNALALLKQAGLSAPVGPSRGFTVMGKPFNPAQPDAYLNSFKIKRS